MDVLVRTPPTSRSFQPLASPNMCLRGRYEVQTTSPDMEAMVVGRLGFGKTLKWACSARVPIDPSLLCESTEEENQLKNQKGGGAGGTRYEATPWPVPPTTIKETWSECR